MVALTSGRNTPRRHDRLIEEHPVKGGVRIFAGALVALDAARFAIPGRTALGLLAVGRAEEEVSATVDGGATVRIRRGPLQFVNSAGADQITRVDIGAPAYIVDDQTVAKTNGSGTRSPAGTIRDVDALGVWIDF